MSAIRHLATAPTDTRYLLPGDEVTPHRHDDHQLIYASSGVLEVFVPEGTWFTPSVRAVWVPRDTIHHWQVNGAATVHLVGIPATVMPSAARIPTLVAVSPLVRELMITCSAEGAADSPAGRRLLQVLVDRMQPSHEAPTVLPTLTDQRLQHVQRILESDMTTSLSLTELGRRVGASDRTLSRLFQQELGMGYTTWRTQLRLHRAILMLAEGKSVTNTAGSCGFSSPSAFVSVFGAAFGRTPGSLYRS